MTRCPVGRSSRRGATRKLRSELLELDAKGWLISGALNMALLIAFALGVLAEHTDCRSSGVYADSIVLVVLALVMLPVPLSSCVRARRALREVLQIAPPDLRSSTSMTRRCAPRRAARAAAAGHEAGAWRRRRMDDGPSEQE